MDALIIVDEFNLEERRRVQKLGRELDSMGVLSRKDIEWLLDSTDRYYALKGLAERDWARNYTEKFVMSLEIEDLVRQLDE